MKKLCHIEDCGLIFDGRIWSHLSVAQFSWLLPARMRSLSEILADGRQLDTWQLTEIFKWKSFFCWEWKFTLIEGVPAACNLDGSSGNCYSTRFRWDLLLISFAELNIYSLVYAQKVLFEDSIGGRTDVKIRPVVLNLERSDSKIW